ncbi:hypothetical protein ABIB94_007106 [Bradyrhizobium sp. JR7.2]
MSILLYRDLDERDIAIKNPTDADWSECVRIICERNKFEFRQEFLRKMRGSILMAALTCNQP